MAAPVLQNSHGLEEIWTHPGPAPLLWTVTYATPLTLILGRSDLAGSRRLEVADDVGP